MTKDADHARIRYLIRRPARSQEDAQVALDAQRTIRKVLGEHIVPFDLATTNKVSISNTGISIRVDRNDLNSWRIDVNVLEPTKEPLEMFGILTDLAYERETKLKKNNKGRDVRCFLSFELK